jgi:hypothetical protein
MAFAFLGIGAGGHKGGVQELASVCHPTIGSVLRERKPNSTSTSTIFFFVLLSVYFCDTLLQEHGGQDRMDGV